MQSSLQNEGIGRVSPSSNIELALFHSGSSLTLLEATRTHRNVCINDDHTRRRHSVLKMATVAPLKSRRTPRRLRRRIIECKNRVLGEGGLRWKSQSVLGYDVSAQLLQIPLNVKPVGSNATPRNNDGSVLNICA